MEPLKKAIKPYHMPQMTGISYKYITSQLDEMGIQYQPINVAVSQLKALQKDIDLNQVKSISAVENKDDIPPIWISRKAHILDGHTRSAGKTYSEGTNGRIKAIRIDADEKDGCAILKVIQDRWERQNKNI